MTQLSDVQVNRIGATLANPWFDADPIVNTDKPGLVGRSTEEFICLHLFACEFPQLNFDVDIIASKLKRFESGGYTSLFVRVPIEAVDLAKAWRHLVNGPPPGPLGYWAPSSEHPWIHFREFLQLTFKEKS